MDGEKHGSGGARGLSRRRLLQTTAAAGVGLPLAHSLFAGDEAFAAADPKLAVLECAVPMPTFSVAERDRRWSAVRAIMARPQWNLDAIITPDADHIGDNARYLTQVVIPKGSQGGVEVLFPRDAAKPVVAHLSGARFVDEWTRRLQGGGWLSDGKLQLKPDGGSADMVKLLSTAGFNRSGTRIGVAKLKGSRFDPEGLASETWMARLRSALPGVEFLPIDQFPPERGNDTGPIEDASMSKGPEEIERIKKAVAINELAIAAAIAAARAGARRQVELWWPCFQTLYAGSGCDPVRCSLGVDGGGNLTLGEPTDHPVRVGQICNQEISSAYEGYGCQINHAFFIGSASTPGYEYYRTAVELLAKVIESAIAFIQPGKTTYGDFQAHNEEVFKQAGHKGSGTNTHGGGIGYLSRPRQSAEDNRVVMQPGHTFDFKPAVVLDRAKIKDVGERNRSVQVGEAIVVTAKGAARLGTRRIVPIATEAAT